MEIIWTALASGAVGAALASFLLKDWLAVRLKAEIEREGAQLKRVSDAKWELKRQACLDALAVVDASFSNLNWSHAGGAPNAVKQAVDTVAARAVMNRLALACDGSDVLAQYVKSLGLREPGESGATLQASQINALRNAIRKELGFGSKLELDDRLAFIARLAGDSAA